MNMELVLCSQAQYLCEARRGAEVFVFDAVLCVLLCVQLFCKELLERERERARRQRGKSPPLDPVSSSRVPNAASEPPYKTRYESPMFACAPPLLSLSIAASLPLSALIINLVSRSVARVE